MTDKLFYVFLLSEIEPFIIFAHWIEWPSLREGYLLFVP